MAADEDALLRLDALRFAADVRQQYIDRVLHVTLDLLRYDDENVDEAGQSAVGEEVFRNNVRRASKRAIALVDIVTEEINRKGNP